MTGSVYIMRDALSRLKVGVALFPARRAKELKLDLLWSSETLSSPYKAERLAHDALVYWSLGGEMFSAPREIVQPIVQWAIVTAGHDAEDAKALWLSKRGEFIAAPVIRPRSSFDGRFVKGHRGFKKRAQPEASSA